jgi:hypothetical protein
VEIWTGLDKLGQGPNGYCHKGDQSSVFSTGNVFKIWLLQKNSIGLSRIQLIFYNLNHSRLSIYPGSVLFA